MKPAQGCLDKPFVSLHESIGHLAVVPYNILHIRGILETTLYLEGGDPRMSKCRNMLSKVQVFKGEEWFIADQHLPFVIDQVKVVAADLGTLATVTATSGNSAAYIALPAVAHTQSPVYKALQLH